MKNSRSLHSNSSEIFQFSALFSLSSMWKDKLCVYIVISSACNVPSASEKTASLMSKRTSLPMRKDQSLGEKSPQSSEQHSPSRVIQHLMSNEECNWWQKCKNGVQGQCYLWLDSVTICRHCERCNIPGSMKFVAITILQVSLPPRWYHMSPYGYNNFIWKLTLHI